MAIILNATTNSGLSVVPDNSGQIQLQSGGTNVATINSNGLTMNSGNIVQSASAAPAFNVTNNTNQSITSNTETVVQFQSKQIGRAHV